jgi:malate dehydrogenase (oxaloacetate-decarboxylating)
MEVFARGHALRQHPVLNKGTAFTPEERVAFGLRGVVPPHTASMEEQLERVAENYDRCTDDLQRHLSLVALQDRNQTLFHRFALEHLEEVLPILYTPTVGQACQRYSHIYRKPHGLYITPDDQDDMDELLANSGLEDVALMVVTDGERILGTGDQGAGGIGISIGKLTLYTLGAGLHPTRTLPVVLDVGTESRRLLDDPMYLGLRQPRLRGAPYFALIDAFVDAVARRWPGAIVQWEDLAKRNAFDVLDRYREVVPSFNDDILGTGAVVLAALVNALQVARVPLTEARVLFLGAGEACIGSGRALLAAKQAAGCSEEAARAHMAFLDTHGLVTADRPGLEAFKRPFARPAEEDCSWADHPPGQLLLAAIEHFRPHALVGATGVPGTFTEEVVRAFAAQQPRPILFALSNPSDRSEGHPDELYRWSQCRAVLATGSPFPPVEGPSGPVTVAQANNMLVFPGVGLGARVAAARTIPDALFAVAAQTVSAQVPPDRIARGTILPPVKDIRAVSRAVARAVALEAVALGVAPPATGAEIDERLDLEIWWPEYMEMVPGGALAP